MSETWRETMFVLAFLLVATLVIAVTGTDLAISSYFYQSGGWPVGERFPWKLFYRLDRYPAIGLAIFGLCAACYGSYNLQWSYWRHQGIFLVLLLALGPGLLVNAIFKDHWGRPRPREITQFSVSASLATGCQRPGTLFSLRTWFGCFLHGCAIFHLPSA